MKTRNLMVLIAVMAGGLGSTVTAQVPVAASTTTEEKAVPAIDTGKSDLEELKVTVADIKKTLDKLVEELKNRSEAADARMKKIEDTLGTDNTLHFGGISRKLEEMERTLDDIERKVDDVERNQR